MGNDIDDSDESYAWRTAGHLTHRSPAYGIAACWARYHWWCKHRDLIDTMWDEAICRGIRGEVSALAWEIQARS